ECCSAISTATNALPTPSSTCKAVLGPTPELTIPDARARPAGAAPRQDQRHSRLRTSTNWRLIQIKAFKKQSDSVSWLGAGNARERAARDRTEKLLGTSSAPVLAAHLAQRGRRYDQRHCRQSQRP